MNPPLIVFQIGKFCNTVIATEEIVSVQEHGSLEDLASLVTCVE